MSFDRWHSTREGNVNTERNIHESILYRPKSSVREYDYNRW